MNTPDNNPMPETLIANLTLAEFDAKWAAKKNELRQRILAIDPDAAESTIEWGIGYIYFDEGREIPRDRIRTFLGVLDEVLRLHHCTHEHTTFDGLDNWCDDCNRII